MEESKLDVLKLVMQPYVLPLLNALDKPKRFNDLMGLFKSRRTLTIKLSKLKKMGLIEYSPIETDKGYANGYAISKKGKEFIKKLNKLKF
jgi:DNA-binding HxlR family transcriptional regulator